MRRLSALTIVCAILSLLGACTADTPEPHPTPTSTPATSELATAASHRPPYRIVGRSGYLTEPGRWAMPAYGNPWAPMAVFDVPARSQGHEVWIWFDIGRGEDRQFGQVMYSAPTGVPRDPCRPQASMQRVGPTLDDLVELLVRQRRTTTSVPRDVTLAGHDGIYLELTVEPAVARCRPGTGAVIYQVAEGEARILEDPATDRYWILDVDGHRVVLTAMTAADRSPRSEHRVVDIVESVEFVPPVE